jgi:dihydropteroate synthase
MTDSKQPRILFVTGRLAEFALRRVLEELAPRAGFIAEVAVLPITVAALMTPKWAARHLQIPPDIARVIVPGYCKGDMTPLTELAGAIPIEHGPNDLRELPRYFDAPTRQMASYGGFDIEILAEINHAQSLTVPEILKQAAELAGQGADRIDLGTDPGGPWSGIAEAVGSLRSAGYRVSIDSFDPLEVSHAVGAGADLILSVNKANRHLASDWGVEVVVIPDQPGTLAGLGETIDYLQARSVPFRVDPILEPIGLGFAASLGRYLEVRQRYPSVEILMGIGNLTELTDVDSAGVNALLAGFCQELAIRSVLTTSVANWARSSVRELDIARRLMHFAVTNHLPPKRVETGLVCLRDPSVPRFGPEALDVLWRGIRDPNWRLFAEDGSIVAINGDHFLRDPDPFVLFESMEVTDASHAFYLGYELAKARIALTLSKRYQQDQALEWGHLTEPETSALARRHARRREEGLNPQASPDRPSERGEDSPLISGDDSLLHD